MNGILHAGPLLSFLTIIRPIKGMPNRLCLASRAVVRGCADRQGGEQSANQTFIALNQYAPIRNASRS